MQVLQTTSSLLALALVFSVSAKKKAGHDALGLPPCASHCLALPKVMEGTSCASNDLACLCKSEVEIWDVLAPCVDSFCASNEDFGYAMRVAMKTCATENPTHTGLKRSTSALTKRTFDITGAAALITDAIGTEACNKCDAYKGQGPPELNSGTSKKPDEPLVTGTTLLGTPPTTDNTDNTGTPPTTENTDNTGTPPTTENTDNTGTPPTTENTDNTGTPPTTESTDNTGTPPADKTTDVTGSDQTTTTTTTTETHDSDEHTDTTGGDGSVLSVPKENNTDYTSISGLSDTPITPPTLPIAPGNGAGKASVAGLLGLMGLLLTLA